MIWAHNDFWCHYSVRHFRWQVYCYELYSVKSSGTSVFDAREAIARTYRDVQPRSM